MISDELRDFASLIAVGTLRVLAERTYVAPDLQKLIHQEIGELLREMSPHVSSTQWLDRDVLDANDAIRTDCARLFPPAFCDCDFDAVTRHLSVRD